MTDRPQMSSSQAKDAQRAGEIMVVPGDVLHPDHGFLEAESRLARTALSLLPVVDGDEVVGVLTEAALQAWRNAPMLPGTDATVTDYMSASVPICREDDSLASLAQAMDSDRQPGFLVVDAHDELIGVVTRGMLRDDGDGSAASTPRPGATSRPHAVKSAARARGQRHGWLKSYAVRPQVRR